MSAEVAAEVLNIKGGVGNTGSNNIGNSQVIRKIGTIKSLPKHQEAITNLG